MKRCFFLLFFALASLCQAATLWLDEVDLGYMTADWGKPKANKSIDGNTINIAGQIFDRGVGTHAGSEIIFKLDGKADSFKAEVGVDREVSGVGTINFIVLGDTKILYDSGTMQNNHNARAVNVDISGIKQLHLIVTDSGDGIDYDHADWGNARIIYNGIKPQAIEPPSEEKYILTPPAPDTPRINSASIFGVRPGSPVLYTVAASGIRPMEFSAKGLPQGVTIDRKNGQIRGRAQRGSYKVSITAENKLGKDSMVLSLEVGDKVCLTPPMGWNSWNCWGCAIDEQKIRDSAQWMIKSGLINYGWQYINIDDCWMRARNSDDETLGGAVRDEQGYILTNGNFPDMRELTDYIHSIGLKAGLYISPGPWTCQNYEGSYKHEKQDAEIFAMWGFDYLKYDWCGYHSVVNSPDLVDLKLPYVFMKWYLDQQDRDIVYSLCQYGMGDVWEWGGEVGGHCWRTTGDIFDTWGSMSGIGFSQDKCSPFAKPGNFNDPDMLVVGKVGWGPNLHDTRLTPNEQYTHISLWSLLASPLLIGCDLSQMDDFTLNLLTNNEVNAVNQDPLCRQAVPVSRKNGCEVWARPLADGSLAVGLFNRSFVECEVTADFSDLGITGKHTVRDLWRQQDLGKFSGSFTAKVPRHGVVFVKISK